MLSPSDTAIVFLLALLLFGPEQLPKLARQLGEAMRHIQNTTHAFMQEMERAGDAAEPTSPHVHADPFPIEPPLLPEPPVEPAQTGEAAQDPAQWHRD